jgi:Uma2 family endonuclease
MTTLRTDRPPVRPQPAPEPPLRLDSGDRMDSDTFMAIYERMPEGFRAQLVRGVVLVASPMTEDHGRPNSHVSLWLGYYEARTPGVLSHAATTTRLGPRSHPEPDASLMILPECGGQARVENHYIVGAPELVVEVAYSSWAVDLHDKRQAYEEAGVREYVVVDLQDRRVHGFALRERRFEEVAAGEDGLHRSEVFPGLWLDAHALVQGDAARLLAALERGTASPEHAAFAARLAEARSTGPDAPGA